MSVFRVDESVRFHASYQSLCLVQVIVDYILLMPDILAPFENFQYTVYCTAHSTLSVLGIEENLFVAECHSYLIQCFRDNYCFHMRLKQDRGSSNHYMPFGVVHGFQLYRIEDVWLNSSYADAADRGVIYKCVFEKLHRVGIRDDGYNVLFTSILSIHDAGGVKRIRIYSRGDAIRTTPSYPENVTGFFFRNYTQEYELLDTSDGNKERN